VVPYLLALAAGLSLAGCGEGVAAGSGPPLVVAAENTWGSIAGQLTGNAGQAESVITNPADDPHAYEPTANDGRMMATASLAIVNGIGYDPWARHLLDANPTPGRIVLDVGKVLGVGDGGNPHRWYDPTDVETVARTIAVDLERLNPRGRATYRVRLQHFLGPGLAAYHHWVDVIRRRYAGLAVGASESMFALQAPALGLRVLTPPGFMRAISEGTDPTAGELSTALAQLSDRAVTVWILNRQNDTPQVDRLTALARTRGIPVVTITETLDPASASFEQWQVGQLERLAAALARATR
jgi:zinc/manganese transport system substrate-binding protein